VDSRPDSPSGDCRIRLAVAKTLPLPPPPEGWAPLANVRRPSDRDEVTVVWVRRATPP
jgi:hypothetical protein